MSCAAGFADHLDAETALAFADHAVTEAERAEVERRIDACAECRGVVALAARRDMTQPATIAATPLAQARARDVVPGEAIGRYVVERRIGEGGMGVVSLARDPELHRAVVIKLVRPDASDLELEARLRREAQAMAQLSHPNVVQIFDIGRHGDRVFLAMEFIAGQTLDAWLIERERGVGEIVAMFRQCGAGLEAAHRAGLLHRDFKPANVLVDRNGVAKVTDFGLARAIEGPSDAPAKPRVSGVHAVLTHHDAVMGTPAYMSPEQAAGEPLDARTDQYALALALLDALAGQHPARRTIEPGADLEVARPRAPAKIRAAVARALRVEPSERFPDLAGFLRELAPERKRRGRWLAPVAVLALGTAGVSIYVATRPADTCVARAPRAWRSAARAAVAQQLAAKPRAFAAWHVDHVLAQIDAAADDIGLQEVARCEGKDVDEACLRTRAQALAAIASRDLGDPAAALRALACDGPPASDDYPRADALEVEGRELLAAGRYSKAAKAFVAEETAGERVGDDAIRGRALLGLLDTARMHGKLQAAENTLENLDGMLARHGNQPGDVFVVAITAAQALIDLGDTENAFAQLDRAAAAATSPDDKQRAHAMRARAEQLMHFDPEAAQREISAALAIATAPAARSGALGVAVELALRRGDHAAAQRALDEAVQLAGAPTLTDRLRAIRIRAHAGDRATAFDELARLSAPDATGRARIAIEGARIVGMTDAARGVAELDDVLSLSETYFESYPDREHVGLEPIERIDAWFLRCELDIVATGGMRRCAGWPTVMDDAHRRSPYKAQLGLYDLRIYELQQSNLVAVPLRRVIALLAENQARPLAIAELQLRLAHLEDGSERRKLAEAARPVFAAAGRTAEVDEIDVLLASVRR